MSLDDLSAVLLDTTSEKGQLFAYFITTSMTNEDFMFPLFFTIEIGVSYQSSVNFLLFTFCCILCFAHPIYLLTFFYFFQCPVPYMIRKLLCGPFTTYFCLFSLSHIHISPTQFLLSNILTEFSLRLCTWKGCICKAVCIGELVHLTKDYWLPFKSQSIHSVYL